MQKVLEINQLSKRFGSLLAIDNVSFTVEKGNVYGLLGPNGSGKSTILGMILKVINPTSGSYRWFELAEQPQTLKKVGAIIESPKFYPYLSAQKNLEIVANIKEVSYQEIDKKLALVGLLDRKKDKFEHFSLGMKQRLAIAAALLDDPLMLILDEPTNGLDPEGIIQIREIIQKIAATGTTILLASHLLDEVEKVCSHVVVLNKGKVLYAGLVEEMNPNFGYIEISSSDLDVLENFLHKLPYFSTITRKKSILVAVLKEAVPVEKINKKAFEQGIVLSHLTMNKERLEDHFLQLIHKNKE
ncbi:ATP-binding cassette domain-containing protein [Weeksella virosa]|uniref:ABC transporter ATP-binding protein n=1 Tax=Weeksella virosa TaxID=1014 RepID=UPI0025535C40|nr:ATP-binding cassette domain-containing protein [Weeksella virosa]MDK7374597.1 ATP-binding cassette domain-containing protein [Weeksella virosa]